MTIEQNCTVNMGLELALKYGMWIKTPNRLLVSPIDIAYRYNTQTVSVNEKQAWLFLKPYEEMERGMHVILKWVREGGDAEKICDAIVRMYNFHKDINTDYRKPEGGFLTSIINEGIEQYRSLDLPDRICLQSFKEVYHKPREIGFIYPDHKGPG